MTLYRNNSSDCILLTWKVSFWLVFLDIEMFERKHIAESRFRDCLEPNTFSAWTVRTAFKIYKKVQFWFNLRIKFALQT